MKLKFVLLFISRVAYQQIRASKNLWPESVSTPGLSINSTVSIRITRRKRVPRSFYYQIFKILLTNFLKGRDEMAKTYSIGKTHVETENLGGGEGTGVPKLFESEEKADKVYCIRFVAKGKIKDTTFFKYVCDWKLQMVTIFESASFLTRHDSSL